MVPSFGMCAIFKVPAALAAGDTPRTSAVAAIAPADTTERIFFKFSAFPFRFKSLQNL